MSVHPIAAFHPVAPDTDWEGVRARVMAALEAAAPATWSDHNAVDPGVTLAEAAAFGLADLHYRSAERDTSAWPMEVQAWQAPSERHWHATLPVGATRAIATALAAPAAVGAPSRAEVLEPLVRGCPSSGDALALLTRPPWAVAFTTDQASVVVALLRARLVRRVAHECTDVIAQAVDAQRSTGGTVAERDVRAARALAYSLPLWPIELTAVVRRERRRRTASALVARLDAIAAARTAPAAAAVRATLAADDLTPDEVALAMSAVPVPVPVTPGHPTVPEDLEDAGGRSRVWPPHPLQSLTCEPATAADYARRARAHPEVGRAWAVPGRLAGVDWDGRETTTTVRPPAWFRASGLSAGALTLVVERLPGRGRPISATAFLRDVLRTAIGSEVDQPHPTWRDTLDPLDPRRLICDEVGAALLKTCPVALQARLVTGVGVDGAATIAGVRARVGAYFAVGRPESRPTPATTPLVDGPWPRFDQPSGGWTPGESIRFTEVVQAIVADPDVLGVENLAIKAGTGPFVPSSVGSIELDPDCIPVLAENQCLQIRFALARGCTDA